jgi:NADH-quinone oxidoreductase subunit E
MASEFYSFKAVTLHGKEVSMEEFKGKKILVVNTASKCGFTPQLEGLEELNQKHGDKLVILGFPCNQFMGQEPGSAEDMKAAGDPTQRTAVDPAIAEEDREISEKLATLSKDATPEDRANAVGARPTGLDAPRGGKADDLKRINGIGPVNEKKLNAIGVYHFEQIAGWERPEIRWVSTFLAFPGRVDREGWVEQAGELASNDSKS